MADEHSSVVRRRVIIAGVGQPAPARVVVARAFSTSRACTVRVVNSSSSQCLPLTPAATT